MVCDDVKRVAYFFLDGALGENKKKEFEKHLSDCPGCDDRVSFHRRVRRFVVKRLKKISAPSRLRERIQHQFQGLRS